MKNEKSLNLASHSLLLDGVLESYASFLLVLKRGFGLYTRQKANVASMMKITRIFIRSCLVCLSHQPLQSAFMSQQFSFFFRTVLRAQGEIVNKIMISLMEIYYPSNFGLGISGMMFQSQAAKKTKKGK